MTIGDKVTARSSQCISHLVHSTTYTGKIVKVNKKSIIVEVEHMLVKYGKEILRDWGYTATVKYTFWKSYEEEGIVYNVYTSKGREYGIITFQTPAVEETPVIEEAPAVVVEETLVEVAEATVETPAVEEATKEEKKMKKTVQNLNRWYTLRPKNKSEHCVWYAQESDLNNPRGGYVRAFAKDGFETIVPISDYDLYMDGVKPNVPSVRQPLEKLIKAHEYHYHIAFNANDEAVFEKHAEACICIERQLKRYDPVAFMSWQFDCDNNTSNEPNPSPREYYLI